MKIEKLSLLIILAVVLFTNCNNNESIIADEPLIIGEWKLTEAFISTGGPQYWVDFENGEEINFLDNGTFSSNKFTECMVGKFSVEENKLLLEYNCDGFNSQSENEQGFITYELQLSSDYFILTPTSGPICIEGCSYKYQKKE
ncbi:hypothetical protein OAT18_01510 [Tenacibaculum sp.]|nr:hypothetical protein [Tenacibaculum sp.]